jgi:hypothetical protein
VALRPAFNADPDGRLQVRIDPTLQAIVRTSGRAGTVFRCRVSLTLDHEPSGQRLPRPLEDIRHAHRDSLN